jgi:hypothetical protein
MTGIVGEPNHPNEEVVERITQETEKLRGDVFKLWDSLYQEQRANNKLPDTLSDDFKDAFWNLEDEDEMDSRYRNEYRQFIEPHFTKLFEETLDVRRRREQSGEGSGGPTRATDRRAGAGAEPSLQPRRRGADPASSGEDEIGVVRWGTDDREALKNRFRWPTVPTEEQVRNAQEDLWVIEALVEIIKRTNEGASGPHNATIKEIEVLEIGARAVEAWRQSEDAVVHLGSAKESDGDAHLGGAEVGRYVDDDGALLAPGEESPYAEFKMMPVCMTFVMDQTRIPELLVLCANSELPVEVRSVRLRPDEGDQFEPAAGSAEGEGGMGAASHGPGMQITPSPPAVSLDVPVEIHGIIYIYNPPDREKLGTGTGAEGPAGEVTPAAPSPAPATPPPAGE